MEGWTAVAPHLYIWDNVVNFSHCTRPCPNFRVLQPNLACFRDHHAIGIMEQAAYQSCGGEFAELRAYVLARLLWNPECEVAVAIDGFLAGYYGRSGAWVRRYLDLLHARIAPDRHIGLGLRASDVILAREGVTVLAEAGEPHRQAFFDEIETVR
jgi:hypothetical protein